MVAILPPIPVERPTPSTPLRYGLLQAAVGPLVLPVKARGGGLQYSEALCGGGQGYEINCLEDLDTKAFDENGLNTVLAVPFVVMSNYVCALSTDFDEGFAERMAREKYFSVEQAVLESIFDTGAFAQAPSLINNPDVVTVTIPAAAGVPEQIGVLEQEFYCTTQYGPPGYLHVSVPLFNRLKAEHLIEFDGLRWRTPIGTVVSTGCFSGDEPDGDAPAAGTYWAYMTGQTAVWATAANEVEQIPVEGALNRTTNQYTGLVEREFVVTFDCAIYAGPIVLWTETP